MNEFEYRRTLVCKEFAQNVIELINYLPRFTRRRPFGQMPLAGQLDAHVTCLRRLASELVLELASEFGLGSDLEHFWKLSPARLPNTVISRWKSENDFG